MPIKIIRGEEARKGTLRGINKIADAVASTFGPKGRTVLIEQEFGGPLVSKDGVSVAKAIELKDSLENIGAQFVKDTAIQTNDIAGDGTTTSTVLAREIFKEGVKSLDAGINPMALKRGIDKATKVVIGYLQKIAKPIKDHNRVMQIASISANGDKEIGELVAAAVNKVGKDGVITVEKAKGIATHVKVVEGLCFDKGPLSPYFFTDVQKMRCFLENPYIFITDRKIARLDDIVPVLEKVSKTGRPLVVIADNVEGEALTALVVNKLRGVLVSVAVKAPGFGDKKSAMLQDIATLTGGTVISEAEGKKLESVDLNDLGRAEKVNIGKDSTTIVNGGGDKKEIEARIAQIKGIIKETTSEYEREKLQERLGNLSGCVAVIYVGASSEVEMQEKNLRVEDSLNATRAGIAEGILPGGGLSLIRACQCKELVVLRNGMEEDEKRGLDILTKALKSVLLQIANNAGVNGHIIVQKVAENQGDFGYNAATNEYGNLYEMGVVDPLKVVRLAIEKASSTSSVLLTTDCVLSREKEKNKPGAGMASPMGGGMRGMM